jgi:hypothetical protein
MLAATFRLTQASILGVNLLNLFLALPLLSGAVYLSSLGTDQLQALGLFFLEAHAVGYSLGLVFFAMNCLFLGYLIFKSGYLPKVLGLLLFLAAAGYLVDGFGKVLLPTYDLYAEIFAQIVLIPAFVGELAVCLWLLIKGVKVPANDERRTLTTSRAEGISA